LVIAIPTISSSESFSMSKATCGLVVTNAGRSSNLFSSSRCRREALARSASQRRRAHCGRPIRGEHSNHCPVDALRHLRRRHGIAGDSAGYHLRRAMPRRVELARYNDQFGGFVQLHALIVLARRIALAESEGRPGGRPRSAGVPFDPFSTSAVLLCPPHVSRQTHRSSAGRSSRKKCERPGNRRRGVFLLSGFWLRRIRGSGAGTTTAPGNAGPASAPRS